MDMAIKLVVPKLGLSMTEAKIIEWRKNEGDVLLKGDGVLDIETEKVVYTVEAPADGVLLKILAEVGDVLPIGAAVAYIGQAGEQIPETGESAPEKSRGTPAPSVAKDEGTSGVTAKKGSKIKISPAARKLAQKLNIDYSDIAGSGPNGRIIKEDILAKSETAAAPTTLEPVQAEQITEVEILDQIPYSGMRKTIGSHMSLSWNLAPRVTHHVLVDVTELLELRKKLNAQLPDGQMKVSITDMLTKIIAKALRRFPMVNATLEGDTIKLLKNINIGIAVSLEEGLIVPVIKNADKKDVFSIGQEIRHLSKKARTNSLKWQDIQGGTFTITNLGAYGSVDFFTPIINQPESAILGVGRAKAAPVVINGEIAIRSLMGFSLSFDHRVIDGAPAAEFLAIVIELIKNPTGAIYGPS
jgi:pyruvate dehydrogenase E2 component (dihydrolipoyllysine-residue acetyltransferase)